MDMKHGLAAAAAAIITAAAGGALAQAGGDVQGEWYAQDKSGKIRIAPCPGQADRLCGTIVWMKAPNDGAGKPKLDVNNPDAKLAKRTIMGLPLITGFKPAGPGKWAGGKIYNPEDGKTYNSKLELGANNTLKVSGCVLVICKAQTWTRAS
jgi:uncharacterized protein (DUF2147 family)